MEPWAPKVVEAAKNTSLHTVNASQGVTPIALTDEEDVKEHGAYDPHIWLSLVNAQIEVSNIAAALLKPTRPTPTITATMRRITKNSSKPCKTNMPANSPAFPARISSPATPPLPTSAATSA